jgi:hypothetical protein
VLAGWRSTESLGLTAEEEQGLLLDQKREQQLEAKWQPVLAGGHGAAALVPKGLPDQLRGRIWQLFLDPAFARDAGGRPSVDSLMAGEPHKLTEIMQADLQRTYPRFAFFAPKPIAMTVYRILRAYATIDPDFGYGIGLTFLAGMLASYMDEQRAFWCFVRLLASDHHETRRLYTHGFEGWIQLNTVWALLLEDRFKKVSEHLRVLQVAPTAYTREWFMTAFLELEMRPEIKLAVFDRFVWCGCRALLSFGLVIVAFEAKKIEKRNQKECLVALQKPGQCPAFADWRAVIAKYNKEFLEEKEYTVLFKRSRMTPFS